jgi:bifunctional non-homologous end joining protein LigD
MGKRMLQGPLSRGETPPAVVERVEAAPRQPMPDHVLPMLAHAGSYPEDERDYAFEVKWDGIRAIAYVRADGRVRVRSRNLNDITEQYPELRALGDALGGRDAVLDGEIVAFDEATGAPSFQRLQPRLGVRPSKARASPVPVVYVVFDVLYYDGHDTTQLPYEERRALLESLGLEGDAARLSPSVVGNGRPLLRLPGFEGVVAKRLGSVYDRGARSRAWIKVKEQRRQELVIGGWTPGKGTRAKRLGALLLGVFDEPWGDAFRYAGKVGTGFDDATLAMLQEKLAPLARDTSPFDGKVPEKDARFVEPELVCEVEFTEWTRDGRLRHPSYKGLRFDKDAREVVREEG